MASQYIKLPVEGGSGPSPGVDSFNGRVGVVVSQSGDYSAGIISNTPAGNISSTTVQAAINELDVEKQATITGAATTITNADLTANRAVISDGSGKVAVSTVTSTEVGHLAGVTSSIQTQLNARQPLDAELTAIAGLGSGIVAITGAGTAAARTVSSDSSITVANGNGILGNPTISLPTSGAAPGTYTNANVTVNDRGIITNIVNGASDERNPDTQLRIYDDFTGTAVGLSSYGFTSTVSGTGAGISFPTSFTNLTGRAIGVINCESGTAVNARTTVHSSVTTFSAGYAVIDFQCRLTIDSIGSVAEQFETTFGLIDNTGAGPHHTDGLYFRFNGQGTNVNWECVSSAAGIRTIVTTSSPVLVNNFNIFQIIVNEAATSANFLINGVSVATLNTNIPQPDVGQFFGFGIKNTKLVGTVTEYNTFCDWICLNVDYSSPRG